MGFTACATLLYLKQILSIVLTCYSLLYSIILHDLVLETTITLVSTLKKLLVIHFSLLLCFHHFNIILLQLYTFRGHVK